MPINIMDTISSMTTMDARYQLEMDKDEKQECQVNIATKGGDFFEALNIFNMLRESGKKVVTCAQGICASAGAVILLAGDEVCAAENSIIMFHNPMANLEGVNQEALEKAIENLKKCKDVLNLTISNRCGWKEEKTKKFLDSAQYLTASEAKKMGLIDKILPFKRKKIETSNELPVEVMNFVTDANLEVDRMNLKDVCGKLNISITDASTDDEMVAAIVAMVATQEGQLAEANGKVTELTNKLAEVPVQKQKATLPTTIVNMVIRSRELEVSSLVTEGKITPVVANELKNIFVTPDAINAAADDKGEVVDAFDKTVDALRKNEQVMNFAGKTGMQQVPKFTGDEANLLIRDAEKRTSN